MADILNGIATLLWPVIIILLIVIFRPAVAAIIDSAKSRKFTLKIGGQELTMDEANEQQRKMISDLQSQMLDLQRRIESGGRPAPSAEKALTTERRARAGKILWVDDNPKNNSYYVQQLQDKDAWGNISVDLALTTSDGLKRFDHDEYDVIISDMGRTENGSYQATAGLDLLKNIRDKNSSIPFVIFSSSRAVEEFAQAARELSVTLMTSSPTELFGVLQKEFMGTSNK